MGTLRGFGSALIRVIITAGTHTHTLALVFAVGVRPDSCSFPLVRGDNVSGHFAWRAEISPLMPDKQPFITFVSTVFMFGLCVCVHLKRAGGTRRDSKAQRMRRV